MKTAIRCGIKNTSEIGAEIGLLQRCKKVLQRCKKVRIYLQLSHAPTSMLFLLREARAHFTAALHGPPDDSPSNDACTMFVIFVQVDAI